MRILLEHGESFYFRVFCRIPLRSSLVFPAWHAICLVFQTGRPGEPFSYGSDIGGIWSGHQKYCNQTVSPGVYFGQLIVEVRPFEEKR